MELFEFEKLNKKYGHLSIAELYQMLAKAEEEKKELIEAFSGLLADAKQYYKSDSRSINRSVKEEFKTDDQLLQKYSEG